MAGTRVSLVFHRLRRCTYWSEGASWVLKGLAGGTEYLLSAQLLPTQQGMSTPRGSVFLSLSKQLLFGPGAGQGSWTHLLGAEGSWGFTSFSPSCVTRAGASGHGVYPMRPLCAWRGTASAGLRALLMQVAVRRREAQLLAQGWPAAGWQSRHMLVLLPARGSPSVAYGS